VTTVGFAVPHGSLDYWSRRFKELHIEATRTSRFDADSILVKDFDGIEIELVGKASDDRWVPWPDSPVDREHQIRGFHSVTMCVAEAEATVDLLTGVMGFRRAGEEGKTTRFETGDGGPGAAVDLLEAPEAPVGEEAAGTVHHVAWRAPDDAGQGAWRDVLVKAGRNVTPVIDRYYFKSIYYREPGGVLFEIATDQPGFTVDEAPQKLGSGLSLPPWFQVSRDKLDHNLTPIVVPTTAARGATH
jgi:glyoxalase family protein